MGLEIFSEFLFESSEIIFERLKKEAVEKVPRASFE
jgi:hypothetical protein